MKKNTKKVLLLIGIVSCLAILTIPCFVYEPLNLWVRCSVFKDSSALMRQAHLLFKQKEYEKARIIYWTAYSEAKKRNDDVTKSVAIYDLITDWYDIKDYDVSIAAAEEELRENPNSPIALEYLGKNYDALKNYEKAFSYYIRYVPSEIVNTKHDAKEVEPLPIWEEGKEDKTTDRESYFYDDVVFRLAIFYTYGQGCSIDLSKAANLWQYLDNHKSASATYNLALCYLKGEGVPADESRCFQLCKKAADRGNKAAMKLLSELYREGIGCSQSEEAANRWKKLAEENPE